MLFKSAGIVRTISTWVLTWLAPCSKSFSFPFILFRIRSLPSDPAPGSQAWGTECVRGLFLNIQPATISFGLGKERKVRSGWPCLFLTSSSLDWNRSLVCAYLKWCMRWTERMLLSDKNQKYIFPWGFMEVMGPMTNWDGERLWWTREGEDPNLAISART